MQDYCTLFDSNYLSRGLVMIESLLQVSDAHVYVIAFDNVAYTTLPKLVDSRVTVISLDVFEDPQLLSIKQTRSRAEYCWTCSSSIILYVLKRFSLSQCTYIDADLFFYSDPSILLDEMGEASVLITEHRFSRFYRFAERNGKYCVQFVSFKNTAAGLKVLNWWRERCLEWCYARLEDGKFGDQKYLDDWTTRFANDVHVLRHEGGGLAPWNIQAYGPVLRGDELWVQNRRSHLESRAIFYHFHNTRYYQDKFLDYGDYFLSRAAKDLIYAPYILKLEAAKNRINQIDHTFDPHGARKNPKTIRFAIKRFLGFNVQRRC